MKKLNVLLIFLFGFTIISLAQVSSTIRGVVVDMDSKYPLVGVNVVLVSDTSQFIGTTTDVNGQFKLEGVQVGRHSIKFSYLGYSDNIKSDLILNSGKELIVNVELEESTLELDGVEIVAQQKGEVNNEMATVSIKSFDTEETKRYAGSRNDPARMASNFAGIGGSDDSRNDITVRGNSPMGVLYRVEGIDIPNPNHFAVPGSGGGPVSIINEKTLGVSDFFTGAFPAEYGNTTSGVFDLSLRNGNNSKHEFSAQFGLLGLEAFGEGPINKKKGSSYLVSARYSTLSLMKAMGIQIGTSAVPVYMDATFKLNYKLKNNASISLFGLGGKSNNNIYVSQQEQPDEDDLYSDYARDQFFNTGMAVLGMSYKKSFNKKTFLRFNLAGTYEEQHSHHVAVDRHLDSVSNKFVVDSTYDKMFYNFDQFKTIASFKLSHKFNSKNILKAGITGDVMYYSFTDSLLSDSSSLWDVRINDRGVSTLIRPHIEYKHKFSDKLFVTFGLYAQYNSLNNELLYDQPRFGLQWKINPKHILSFGAGRHSQLAPNYVVLSQEDFGDGYIQHNKNIGSLYSNHFILGYQYAPSKSWKVKTEVYYQYLQNIPVETNSSSYAIINQGVGFDRFFPDSLVNNGTGENYGIELTVEKYFSKRFFVLFTGSLFESKYRGSDGVYRDTDFNGKWIVNTLGGYEIPIKKNSSIGLGLKFTAAGGKRYSPIDRALSDSIGEIVFIEEEKNTTKLADYMRLDFKVNWKLNTKKLTHEVGIDIVNVTNRVNVMQLTYSRKPGEKDPIRVEPQLGLLPIFYYRIDF